MPSRKENSRKFLTTPVSKLKWRVMESKTANRRKIVVGYIVKVQVTRPVKAWSFQAFTVQHKYIGQAFTLRGALKKFESRLK